MECPQSSTNIAEKVGKTVLTLPTRPSAPRAELHDTNESATKAERDLLSVVRSALDDSDRISPSPAYQRGNHAHQLLNRHYRILSAFPI